MTDLYFDWLVGIVCDPKHKIKNYYSLLHHLYLTEFTWIIDRDENRAAYGLDLRKEYEYQTGDIYGYGEIDELLNGSCSLLEMLVALAIQCEDIMFDGTNRTNKWFWIMLENMAIDDCTEQDYDSNYVDDRIDILLNRTYERNGRGGLFYIRNCKEDLRKVEIWYQCSWFLDTLYERGQK